MKFKKECNWFQLNLTKNKSLYVGPYQKEYKGVPGTYEWKIYSFITRRFKLCLVKSKVSGFWEIQFAGRWTSTGTKHQGINYRIDTVELNNKELEH